MKVTDSLASGMGKLGGAIGKGIIAGAAGTLAITLSQMIEMKITGREESTAPADAATKALDIEPVDEESKEKFSQEVHWAYGTTWGIVRGLMSLTGLKGWPATAAHFAAIMGAALVIEPALDVAPPLKEWDKKTIATDAFHHAVYAIAAGFVYDAISDED